MKRSFLLLTALALLFAESNIFSHDMWLEPVKSGYKIAYGHGKDLDDYDHKKIKEVLGFNKDGRRVKVNVKRSKKGCSIEGASGISAFVCFMDNGYWMHTNEGWKNFKSRKAAKAYKKVSIIKAGHSNKYTKHIVKWDKFLIRPIGKRYEIVPLKNPTILKEGDKLPVMIYYNGKPVESAKLSSFTSGEDGHGELKKVEGNGPFMVKIGTGKKHIIKASIEIGKEKDAIWHSCTFTFNIHE